MRFGFVTCVQLGLSCMEEIYSVGGKLDLVLTLPDDRATGKSGRVFLDSFCADNNIRLKKINNINDPDAISAIRAANLDWLFIIGWSQIARKEVLESPGKGVLGIHPTLLPRGRGRASIPWAILKGLTETGVTLFKLDEGVDTGPILAQEKIPISHQETASTLYTKVAEAHRTLIRIVWRELSEDQIEPVPQNDDLATQWPGRKPEDGEIASSMTVEEVDRLVRAVTHPYPGAFIRINGKRLKIWRGDASKEAAEVTTKIPLTLADGTYYALDYEWDIS